MNPTILDRIKTRFGFFCLIGLLLTANRAYGQLSSLPVTRTISSGQLHVSSSNTGANPFEGININSFVGAERFYDAGFDGTGAIVGNIEAGHVDSNHDVLGHVTTKVTGTGAAGTLDDHATWVTHSMSGKIAADAYDASNYYGFGIGKGAETWSGAIATSFGSGGSFSVSNASTASVYSTMLKTGVNGQTVDIFNSSWGYSSPSGFNVFAIGVDGFLNDTGKIGVASAGNSGSGSNTVGGIGAGYNSITVGSLGSDTAALPYDAVSGFSSRSPNDFRDLDPDQTVSSVRAAVDIVAPGQNLTLAANGTSSSYNTNLQGTSFSAPIVAGGASLIVGAGKNLYAGNSKAIDGRVVKAVLLNGATKITGWDNGQAINAGVIETTQSLDWASGAGGMNLDASFDQYVNKAAGGQAGTTDVAGLFTGDQGNVDVVGWDFGFVGNDTGVDDSNLYFIDQQLLGGTDFTVTLTWFADMISGADADFSNAGANHLANLDLTVFEFDTLADRNIIGTTAQSFSLYNVVEHLHFQTTGTGFYGISVDYSFAQYDFDTPETGEFYGLSWSGVAAVPEPGSLLAIGFLGAVVACRRRRRAAA
ncbi:MAG: PEP-CTERM sorting domain-containing protein [Mariniblastus sp.]|nr:PEP-CTERM sorting domain-containing protein [Mariniblastus sp.]